MRTRMAASRSGWLSFLGLCLLMMAVLAPQQPVQAQTATGTVTGTVTDPTGLPILDVGVVVRNTDTGTESRYTTNGSGLYVAPYLQPGNYEVTASKEGFSNVLHKDVVVHVGDRLTVNIQLPVQGTRPHPPKS
jgi:hypothetical protein